MKKRNFKLMALGSESGKDFYIVETKVKGKILHFPIDIDDPRFRDLGNVKNITSKQIKDLSTKFKLKLISAYKNNHKKDIDEYKEYNIKNNKLDFYIRARKNKDFTHTNNIQNPIVIMGKKIKLRDFLTKLIMARGLNIWYIEKNSDTPDSADYLELSLPSNFKVYIFQPPKNWKLNKLIRIGS